MPDPAAVNTMFGRIAGRYDRANRLLSAGLDMGWRRRLVREVTKISPTDIVDIATGSGDVAFTLQRALNHRANVTGIDFCQPMLDEAERRKSALPQASAVRFLPGDMLNLPLGDQSADAVTIAFGLRNAGDRAEALQEMRRILRRPEGHLFVLEFSRPRPWFRPIYFTYLRHVLPTLATWITGDRMAYEYLCGSIESYPSLEAISREIRQAGFSDVRAIPLTFGVVALHIARV